MAAFHKRFIFVRNNPHIDIFIRLPIDIFPEGDDTVEQMVYAYEIGELNDTLHIQGYVRLNVGMTLNQFKKKMEGYHVEAAVYDGKVNFKYCTKQGLFYSRGFEDDKRHPDEEYAKQGFFTMRKIVAKVGEVIASRPWQDMLFLLGLYTPYSFPSKGEEDNFSIQIKRNEEYDTSFDNSFN